MCQIFSCECKKIEDKAVTSYYVVYLDCLKRWRASLEADWPREPPQPHDDSDGDGQEKNRPEAKKEYKVGQMKQSSDELKIYACSLSLFVKYVDYFNTE